MIAKLVAFVRRRGFQRGVLGDSRAWMAVWGVLTMARFVRRATRSKDVVERFELAPGQTLVVTDLGVSER